MRRVLRIRTADRAIFEAIADGRKTVETRAASPYFLALVPGDELLFMCGPSRLVKAIKAVNRYDSVPAMLDAIDWRLIAPDQTQAELAAAYERWNGTGPAVMLAFTLD